MIRYKHLGGDQWLEDGSKRFFSHRLVTFFTLNGSYSIPTNSYVCCDYNITNMNIESEDYKLSCHRNLIKSFNVNNHTYGLKSDNIKIFGSSEEVHFKIVC